MNTNFFDLARKDKKDILYELLTDNRSEGIVSTKELKAINRLIGDTVTAHTEKNKKTLKKTGTRGTKKSKKKGTKKKTTHYLSQEVFSELDNAKDQIRSLVPEKARKRISKTKIVNQALSLILEEFATKGEKSKLVRYLIQKELI